MANMRDYVIGVIGALPVRIPLPSRPPHALGYLASAAEQSTTCLRAAYMSGSNQT
eukprot:CAMPEP_0115884132 /NCGR_PEP_ID=MMETSP0287-20121206/29952_1 /TAXON_ID=412157 /ORGANISM="Chrysochromulina rotalis, Strain UIO044" /LENGTH=54 /DNA_ID=CAMNT_0003340411 /DNA_START=35 /DNA_END=195 /DNA_ORIENTATION=+